MGIRVWNDFKAEVPAHQSCMDGAVTLPITNLVEEDVPLKLRLLGIFAVILLLP